MANTRGKTPGYWQKRGESYLLQVCIGTDFKGSPVRYNRTVRCTSDREANVELAKFYAECCAGKVQKSGRTTLGSIAAKWFETHVEINLKKTTISGYRQDYRLYIEPYFAGKQISKIRPLHIQEWISHLIKGDPSRKPLSPKTLRNAMTVLHQIFVCAKRWGEIEKNPCADVQLPALRKNEAKYYDKQQLAKLLSRLTTVENLKYKTAILLTIFTGIRKGELLGLKWGYIDFAKNEIKISNSRVYTPDFGTQDDIPKTKNSVRTISVPDECIALLKELLLQQKKDRVRMGSKWTDTGYVLIGYFGAPISPNNLTDWFRLFLEANGLPALNFHGLRHTHTAMLAYIDMDKIRISRRLGHANVSTTLDIYGHLFETADREIADELSARFLQG